MHQLAGRDALDRNAPSEERSDLQSLIIGDWLGPPPFSSLHCDWDSGFSDTTPSATGSERAHTLDEDVYSASAPPTGFDPIPFPLLGLNHWEDVAIRPHHVTLSPLGELDLVTPEGDPAWGSHYPSESYCQNELNSNLLESSWNATLAVTNAGVSLNEVHSGIGTLTPTLNGIPRSNNEPMYPANTSMQRISDFFSEIYRCNWPACSPHDTFCTFQEYEVHLKCHAREVRKKWDLEKPCSWFGCKSKAKHKSLKLFEKHLTNFHINPLMCPVEDCRHKRPFRGNHDLQRHIATAHVKLRYQCPYPICQTLEFPRTDKWLLHLRKVHDTDPCPYAHCWDGKLLDSSESTAKHIGKGHGRFECGLRCCYGTISKFSDSALLEHLEIDHAMDRALSMLARDTAKAAGHVTLRAEHVSGNTEIRNCVSCGKQ